MRPSNTDTRVALYLSWLIGVILVVLPFHALLSVWLASIFGHYTLLRLWKELLLIILICGTVYLIAKDSKLRKRFISYLPARLIAAYILISIIWGAGAYALNKVTAKALGYGLIVNLRFLVFFLVVWVVATKSSLLKRIWLKLLLWPAAGVVIFGITERLFLPIDFLKHFGYGPNTIYPYETINHNLNYPRIMSTLRGANPLGAYLIVVISALAVLINKTKRQRLFLSLAGLASLATLIFSYSREAWIGMALSLAFLVLVAIKNPRLKKMAIIISCVLIVTGLALGGLLRNNATLQNVIFHTQNGSSSKLSSNQQHASAFKGGLKDIAHNPLGEGVGTAGPASVYNNGKGRVAENYYIQIGQEIGWLGIVLFLAINYLVAIELWRKRADTLPLVLLVSLIGISFINLFSHAWADDTLAYIWWGLAGVACAPAILKTGNKNGKSQKRPA